MGVLSWWGFALFGISIVASACGEGILMCYYGTWATYRPGAGRFDTTHLDPGLCTHAVYTFVGLNADGTVRILDPYLDLPNDWGRDNFRKFNDLKKINPALKTILAIGGWNEGSATYSQVLNTPALRATFVKHATETVLKYGFDGLDLDWEYPNRRDTVFGETDVKAFTAVLAELRAAFRPHGLLLTAAVASVESMASLSYDVVGISEHLDFISIMAYDMNGAWDTRTGHNAPLHRGLGDENVPRRDAYSVDVSLEYWLAQGAPPEKLLLGLPLYGRTFELSSPTQTTPRSPVIGPGLAGPYTRQNGILGYNEICQLLRTGRWTTKLDGLAKVPYAFNGRDWITYDDVTSLTLKTEFAMKHSLAGVMVWSIETDDFRGSCHRRKFPLLRAINAALNRTLPSAGAPTDTTFRPGSGNRPDPEGTAGKPIASGVCAEEGYVRDREDCGVFYYCGRAADGVLIASRFECPAGLHWDVSVQTCNYPNLAHCDVGTDYVRIIR